MHFWEIGFWGAFFGTVALMLVASLAAYLRSRERVALTAALSSLVSALFVVAFLGGLPLADPDAQARLLAHVAIVAAGVLGLMLRAELGLMRDPAAARRARMQTATLGAATMAASWLLEPSQALAFGSAVAVVVGFGGLSMTVRSVWLGDRLAWAGVFAVASMLVTLIGLSWIAMDRDGVPWQVHPLSALGGMAYLAALASMMWQRYSYLIELREVLVQGPSYDPITRMRSNAETGNMVGMAFFRQQQDPSRPVGVIAAVVAMARDMSRTAWSYSSRVAWHDLASAQIAELPATETA